MEVREILAGRIDPDELLRMSMDLIRIPSYPGIANQETAAAEYIQSVFEANGVETWIDPLKDGRGNVFGRIRGTGGGKNLLLCGHTDTVPPYGMERALDPWLDEKGLLHGRGASDMKAADAAMMGALLAVKRSGIKLRGDLVFAGVADEEERSLGLTDLLERGYRADAAIVGEAMGKWRVGTAQRGLEWYELHFIGKTVHGGDQDEGVNAILKALDFIDALRKELLPKLNARVHPKLGRSTINIGVIRGGTQLSTVPGECEIQLDRRFLPWERYEDVEAEFAELIYRLAKADPGFHCEVDIKDNSVMAPGYVHQGFDLPDEHPFVQAAKRALESAGGGGEATLAACPCWTDAGLLNHYGKIPAVIFGPGELSSCHSDGEFLDSAELPVYCLAYALAAADFCGADPSDSA